MRKHILLPALALSGGAAGFILRKWQLSSGFEADTGLALPHAPSALAVAGFSAFLLLLLLFLSWREEKQLPWELAFSAGKEAPLAVTALILAAMLLLAGAGAEIVTYVVNGAFFLEGETPFSRAASAALPPLRIALSIGALPCIFFSMVLGRFPDGFLGPSSSSDTGSLSVSCPACLLYSSARSSSAVSFAAVGSPVPANAVNVSGPFPPPMPLAVSRIMISTDSTDTRTVVLP